MSSKYWAKEKKENHSPQDLRLNVITKQKLRLFYDNMIFWLLKDLCQKVNKYVDKLFMYDSIICIWNMDAVKNVIAYPPN